MTDINEAKRVLLAQWEKERDELNLLIARLRKDLGISGDSNGAVAESREPSSQSQPTATGPVNIEAIVSPGDFFGMTQVQAAKAFLLRANQPASLQDIAKALYRGKATDNLIEDAALRNLSSVFSRSQELASIARGRWGLREWYPNRAFKKNRKAKEETESETQTDTATKQE